MVNKLSAAFVAMSLIAAAQPASAQTVVKVTGAKVTIAAVSFGSKSTTLVTVISGVTWALDNQLSSITVDGVTADYRSLKPGMNCILTGTKINPPPPHSVFTKTIFMSPFQRCSERTCPNTHLRSPKSP